MNPLRVLVLRCDGVYQRHLEVRASSEFSLVGVVVQQGATTRGGIAERLARYRNPFALWRQLQARALLPAYERRARALHEQLFGQSERQGTDASVPRLVTAHINAPEVADFIRAHQPDIVIVNGTQLLREPILALLAGIPLGIVNLHTGLSPYSRGGNCNLFMMLAGKPELVGVTVHHIDRGIDSGDIILTSHAPMQEGDTFEMIEARCFHLGIEMLLRACRLLQEGRAPRVRQWEEGTLFLRRTGYVYEPYQRLAANRLIAAGLVRHYLANRPARDAGLRVVGGEAS